MWHANGQNYTRFKLSNALGISVELCSLGATVTAVNVPDINGHFKDVILGFDNAKDYLNSPKTYFGATVGRVANRYVGVGGVGRYHKMIKYQPFMIHL